jgi:hypothetical protein
MRIVAALLALALLGGCACGEDPITMGRADTGVGPPDGGSTNPLQLLPGMTFGYRAILTYRETQLGAEENSQWSMTLRIASTDDKGTGGESTLQFTASNAETMSQGWTPTADYDSWVARLGPALTTDQVSSTAVVDHLANPPQIPARPQNAPKAIPADGTFFLDMRQIDTIRAAFGQAHLSAMPQVVDPSMNAGKWRFSFMGNDPSIVYYPDRLKTRSIQLEYDPRGFLTRLDETIGDTSMRPSATCRVELVSGP